MSKLINLADRIYGNLTVLSRVSNKNGKPAWECLCVCGSTCTVRGSDLRTGNTSSCGCQQKELSRLRFTTHGGRSKRLYTTWSGMKSRCECPTNKSFKYYGAKGVSVCEAWQSFSVFEEWALHSGYTDELTIERINTAKGYCPENCTWVTQAMQVRNRGKIHRKTSSQFIGVHWNKKRSTWVALITLEGKPIRIGNYPSEFDAMKARDEYIVNNKLEGYKLNA